MSRDYIVDEVRRVREALFAQYNFDLKKLLSAVRKRQRKSGHKVVSLRAKKKLSA